MEEDDNTPSFSSQEMLDMVEKNDDTFKLLSIGNSHLGTGYSSSKSSDYSRLGIAIANNFHLNTLHVNIHNEELLAVEDSTFYDGLKRNSSIQRLILHSDRHDNDMNEVGHQILKAYQGKNLTNLDMRSFSIQLEDIAAITTTFKWCSNLYHIHLTNCSITDETFLPMVEALVGHPVVELIQLDENQIGNKGCELLSKLLQDPSSTLTNISLRSNNVGNEGAIAFANSIANSKLETLSLFNNPVDISVDSAFSKALCDTTSILNTYQSNHTFTQLYFEDDRLEADYPGEFFGEHLLSLLIMNEGKNKKHVAIKKILRYHTIMDMEAFFQLGSDDDEEKGNLKALPYLIAWFDRAREAVTESDEEGGGYTVEGRKLSSIYQYVRAMPLRFVHNEIIVKLDAHKALSTLVQKLKESTSHHEILVIIQEVVCVYSDAFVCCSKGFGVSSYHCILCILLYFNSLTILPIRIWCLHGVSG